MAVNDRYSYLKPSHNFPEIKINSREYSSIQIDKLTQSFSKSFSPKTSYNKSFSPSPTHEKSLRSTAKSILNSSNNFSPSLSPCSSFLSPTFKEGSVKIQSKTKQLFNITDDLTMQSSNYGRKISPIHLNVPMRISPDNFDQIAARPLSTRVSESNTEWIAHKQKERLAEKFNKGEYIPSISQMQMYGRKEPISIFEKKELWKGPSS